MPHSGNAESGHELHDGNATGDQRQRRAYPGEKGPLVREREAIVRFFLAARFGRSPVIGRTHETASPRERTSLVRSLRRRPRKRHWVGAPAIRIGLDLPV